MEFFRLARSKGIRPASKTVLVACQALLFLSFHATNQPLDSQWSLVADAVAPLASLVICGWLLLQPQTGSIADVAASIFGFYYLGVLPSHWLRLRAIDARCPPPRAALEHARAGHQCRFGLDPVHHRHDPGVGHYRLRVRPTLWPAAFDPGQPWKNRRGEPSAVLRPPPWWVPVAPYSWIGRWRRGVGCCWAFWWPSPPWWGTWWSPC